MNMSFERYIMAIIVTVDMVIANIFAFAKVFFPIICIATIAFAIYRIAKR